MDDKNTILLPGQAEKYEQYMELSDSNTVYWTQKLQVLWQCYVLEEKPRITNSIDNPEEKDIASPEDVCLTLLDEMNIVQSQALEQIEYSITELQLQRSRQIENLGDDMIENIQSANIAFMPTHPKEQLDNLNNHLQILMHAKTYFQIHEPDIIALEHLEQIAPILARISNLTWKAEKWDGILLHLIQHPRLLERFINNAATTIRSAYRMLTDTAPLVMRLRDVFIDDECDNHEYHHGLMGTKYDLQREYDLLQTTIEMYGLDLKLPPLETANDEVIMLPPPLEP